MDDNLYVTVHPIHFSLFMDLVKDLKPNMGRRNTIWSTRDDHPSPSNEVYIRCSSVNGVRFFVFRDANRKEVLIVFRREVLIKILDSRLVDAIIDLNFRVSKGVPDFYGKLPARPKSVVGKNEVGTRKDTAHYIGTSVIF